MTPIPRPAAGLRITLCALVLALPSLRAVAAGSTSIDQVWAREDAYWRLSKSGDVESYLALWTADASAWPPDTDHPLSKADLARRLADPARPRLGLAGPLIREAASDLGGTVVVYYEALQQRFFADGHTEPARRVKVTHVWKQARGEWLLVGGQAAPL